MRRHCDASASDTRDGKFEPLAVKENVNYVARTAPSPLRQRVAVRDPSRKRIESLITTATKRRHAYLGRYTAVSVELARFVCPRYPPLRLSTALSPFRLVSHDRCSSSRHDRCHQRK